MPSATASGGRGSDLRLVAHQEGQHAGGVSWRVQWPHLQRPEAQRIAGLHRAGVDAVQQIELQRVDQHLELRPLLAQRADLTDVIEMMVREQHMRRLQPETTRRLDQTLDRPPRIDEERGSPLAVCDEICIGQKLGMSCVLDDHPEHPLTKPPGQRRLPCVALIHTCYRITDIDRSVAFYNALGFEEVGRIPIRDEAVNVFMNQPGDGDMPRLELTYNFGVDSYELGTAYGHIAITAHDLDATLARLAEQWHRAREAALLGS